ncbi:SAF domain-containing protein [Actinokineospora sp.]|uniref:SAF domain-containing protein n=1 Tax=Actinokineospora sp. TaxID=1872133 RepID=UPI0040379453
MPTPLSPRLRGLFDALLRAFTLRRVVATALVLLAAALALRPAPDSVPVLVAAHALAPGVGLSPSDVRVVRAPPDLRPESALVDPAEVSGRMLAGAAAEGEPITDVRLVGAANTRLATGPDAAAVPVRLADPAVAGLLRPGTRVDVVTADPRGREPVVLARDAAVVTVRADETGRGSLVLLALPRESATRVASVSLGQPVTVTLR